MVSLRKQRFGVPLLVLVKKGGVARTGARKRPAASGCDILSIYVDCSVEGRHALRTVSSPDGARIQENNAQMKKKWWRNKHSPTSRILDVNTHNDEEINMVKQGTPAASIYPEMPSHSTKSITACFCPWCSRAQGMVWGVCISRGYTPE